MKPDEFLEGILKEVEKGAEGLADKGHMNLMTDLTEIWKNASKGLYHDFHRKGLDLPKVSLITNSKLFPIVLFLLMFEHIVLLPRMF